MALYMTSERNCLWNAGTRGDSYRCGEGTGCAAAGGGHARPVADAGSCRGRAVFPTAVICRTAAACSGTRPCFAWCSSVHPSADTVFFNAAVFLLQVLITCRVPLVSLQVCADQSIFMRVVQQMSSDWEAETDAVGSAESSDAHANAAPDSPEAASPQGGHQHGVCLRSLCAHCATNVPCAA